MPTASVAAVAGTGFEYFWKDEAGAGVYLVSAGDGCKGCGASALDAAGRAAYNPPHDAPVRDHHSNYMPGALRLTSRRDKAHGKPRRPLIQT